MPTFHYQYRREQRVDWTIEAESEGAAETEAKKLMDGLNLSSEDDESDDPGELELLSHE